MSAFGLNTYRTNECSLLEAKRTSQIPAVMSAFVSKRTSAGCSMNPNWSNIRPRPAGFEPFDALLLDSEGQCNGGLSYVALEAF
jgi:hypothetical protein